MMSKVLNLSYRSFTGWNLMLDETGGPNVGPFFCGGLITRNSVTGALSYSGQYKAFRQVARFMDAGAAVEDLSIVDRPNGMSTYPKGNAPLQASAWKNPDGSVVYLLVNPDAEKKQIEIEENGQTFYVEALPNSVSTVVISE